MGRTTQNYDILTRLAVGNGALVYRGVDKVSHRQVALKLLVQDGDVDHRFNVAALLADSPRLKQITGAHVCQLLNAYQDDDGPVLVYEFANGVSATELAAQRKLDASQVLDIAAQLISAMRSGERQKCPHGDVKPSNIVFMELADKRLFTLILDWGLTAYRTAMADDSLLFLAPERLAGAPASHRADLFSAGAALFFLCTGKTLVAGTDRTQLQAAWPNTRPALLTELRPDLPLKFVQWLCSLLELNPEKRPESAVDALVPLAALNPPAAPVPPESFRPRPAKPPALPIASGIVKQPPKTQARPPSAIRKVPPPSATTETEVTPAAKPATAPVKKSHVAMTLGLFGFLVALISGVVWFLFFRNTEPEKYPGDDAAAKPTSTAQARTPAPSVGKSIPKNTPTLKIPPPVNKAAATPTPTPTNQGKSPAPTQNPKPTATPPKSEPSKTPTPANAAPPQPPPK